MTNETKPKTPLTAKWEVCVEAGIVRVNIFRGDLRIANVCQSPQGWRVFPLTTARSNSALTAKTPLKQSASFTAK